jgi:hypothetical protein
VSANEIEVEKLVSRVMIAMKPMLEPIGWSAIVLSWPTDGDGKSQLALGCKGPAEAIAALESAVAILRKEYVVLKGVTEGAVPTVPRCPECHSTKVEQARDHTDHPGVFKCAECQWLGTDLDLVRRAVIG